MLKSKLKTPKVIPRTTDRPDLILGRGPESAPVMFVADSATEHDVKSGLAFSGYMEKEYRALCKEANLQYDSTYRTLYIKTKVDYNGPKVALRKQSFQKALHNGWDYGAILLDEIERVGPNVVVPIGEHAFNFLAGQKSISQFRGSILSPRKDLQDRFKNLKIAPTLGPTYLYADPAFRSVLLIDLDRIRKCSEFPDLFGKTDNVWIADTYDLATRYLDRHANATWGIFDIETRFNIPVCIGICLSRDEAICIPLLDRNLDYANLVLLWGFVDRLLRSRSWANQNMKFDVMNLERIGFTIDEKQFCGDTILNAGLIYPEFKKNLGFLNSIYTDMPYFKGEGKEAFEDGNRRTLYLYCAKDCLSTYRIKVEQEKEIEELNLRPIQQEVNSLFWPYIRMEKRGILVDDSRRKFLFAKYDILYNIQRNLLDKLANRPVNPHSPQQVGDLVYNEWEFPVKKDRKTGGFLTDEDTLSELLAFSGGRFSFQALQGIRSIINCRKIHKVIEYLETPIHPDSRFRSSYNLSGTKTGRTSAGSTTDYLLHYKDGKYILSECGRSLQTIAKHGFRVDGVWYGRDLRSIYVPTPGYIFFEIDGSQAEARVDAVLAKDFDMLPLFDVKPGIHVRTGEWVFNRIIDKKIEPDLYHVAKTVRHAGERNMGPDQFFKIIQPAVPGFTLEECAIALTKFHASQPNIRQVFHTEVTDFVTRNRLLISPHGRRRDFFGKPDHHMFNEAISQIPQATVGDHTKFSIPRINEAFGQNVHWLYEAHDGIMAEIHKHELPRLARIANSVYRRPIDFRGCSLSRKFDLVIPGECKISETTWEDLEDYA